MPMFEISEVDLRDASGITAIAVGQSGDEETFILRLTYVPIGFKGPDHTTVFLMHFDHMAQIAAGLLQTVALAGREEEFMKAVSDVIPDTNDDEVVIIVDLTGE